MVSLLACARATGAWAQMDLPDPRLTPGALNPGVTQENIGDTVCVAGWTRTVRPPENYTEDLKRRQIREYGYADRRLGHYEEDHLVPLDLAVADRSAQPVGRSRDARLMAGMPIGRMSWSMH